MVSSEKLCVKWNNHQMNMVGMLADLRDQDSFADVTLACDGQSVKAHKIILSACSPFLRNLLVNNPCQHPVVILDNIRYSDLKTLLDFIYKGQAVTTKDKLENLFKAAAILKVKGLGEINKIKKVSSNTDHKVEEKNVDSETESNKHSDHHYTYSAVKTHPKDKSKKFISVLSEVKSFSNSEESKDVENKSDEVDEDSDPICSVMEVDGNVTTISSNDTIADEEILDQIQSTDEALIEDVESAVSDPASDTCVLSMPFVESTDDQSITGLSLSELDGKQFAQVTDNSGNTVLVLMPCQSVTDGIQDTVAATTTTAVTTTAKTSVDISSSSAASNKVKISTLRKTRGRYRRDNESDYLELHFKREDGTSMKLYQCMFCDSKFSNPGNVRRHSSSAHKGYRIECEVCHSRFTQKSSKDFHFRTVHAGLRFKCDKCESQFSEKRTLLSHIDRVHNDQN